MTAVKSPWLLLAGLVLARTLVGFEFQSLGSIATSMPESIGLQAHALGAAVGAFMVAGIFVSVPAGLAATRFSDWTVLSVSLGIMLCGAIGTVLVPTVTGIAASRLVGGAGAAAANVIFSKIVIDRFEDRSLQTAMGLLIVSWPLGLGLSLGILGPLAARYGWQAALMATVLACALATLVPVLLGRHRVGGGFVRGSGEPPPPTRGPDPPLRGAVRKAIILSGLAWALFNGAIATILTFAPVVITNGGTPPGEATGMVASAMWVVVVLIPVGGLIADRFRNALVGITLPLLILATASPFLLDTRHDMLGLMAFGALSALPAAALASLPAKALAAGTRAKGMGLYQTIYYASMSILPAIGGYAERLGLTYGALIASGAMLAAAAASVILFERTVRGLP